MSIIIHAQQPLPMLQHVALPNPAPQAPGDIFSPRMNGSARLLTPACAEWTRTAGPDETIVLTGSYLSNYSGDSHARDTRFLVYGNDIMRDAKIQRIDSDKAMITLDTALKPWAMYLIWPKNDSGYGAPIAINKTDAWWLGPDKAMRGNSVSVYGRNLAHANSTNASYVYLKPAAGSGQWLPVTSVNPYKVDFKVPTSLAYGKYEVWVHNGHGGNYGWSGPLVLNIVKGAAWTDVSLNVKDYGAKGDGIADDTKAIINTVNAAGQSAGATVYFPEGVYAISNAIGLGSNMRWTGAGKTKTILQCGANYSGQARSVIYGDVSNIEIRDMSFDRNALGAVNNIDKPILLRGSSDVSLINVGFYFPAFDVMDLHLSRYIYLKGCSITGSSTFLGNCSQLFIDKCIFKLTYDAEVMLFSWGGVGISLTNSTCSDFNNSNPANGAGWGKGRFFVASGVWGSNRFTYLANNTTTNLAARQAGVDQNSGEQFLWEGNTAIWSGFVLNSTSNSATLNGLADSSVVGNCAVVVKGRGLGQSRRITKYNNATITVDAPWNLNPDKTSIVTIGTYANKIVVYKNTLEAKAYAATTANHNASAGIQPYGGVFNFVADNNTLKRVRTGISNWALQSPVGVDPNYFNLFSNNTLEDCRWAIANMPSVAKPNGTAVILGTVFRNNTIKRPLVSGVVNAVPALNFTVLDGVVYEHNHFLEVAKGLESDTISIKNQLLYKNDFSANALGTTYPAIQISPYIALRENTFRGFVTSYSNLLPAILEAPYHVIELTGTAAGTRIDSAFILWNAGTAPLLWTATSNANWLTISTVSGTIKNENERAVVRFRADPMQLGIGVHKALIKIKTGTQSRFYTIVLTVSGNKVCAGAGSISWEYWANITPWRPLSEVPVASIPTSSGQLFDFAMPPNKADKFAARIRGYICPPANGNYIFTIASDDYSELWLSIDDDQAQKQKIAAVSGWTYPYDYKKYAAQQSKPIALENGKRYYVEALYVENYGSDHLSVGWQMPNGVVARAIPGTYLMPFTDSAKNLFNPITKVFRKSQAALSSQ